MNFTLEQRLQKIKPFLQNDYGTERKYNPPCKYVFVIVHMYNV